MPSSLLTDMERGSNGPTLDDHRAIQLALELSMLGLDEETNFGENRAKKSMNMTECVQVPTSEHVAEIVGRQGKICYFSKNELCLHRSLFRKVCPYALYEVD